LDDDQFLDSGCRFRKKFLNCTSEEIGFRLQVVPDLVGENRVVVQIETQVQIEVESEVEVEVEVMVER
jgi:hypothetical protein